MFWIIAAAALSTPASADSFTLQNGSTVEGTLATYELGGNCQIFVATGQVRGATLLLPCDQILAYARQVEEGEEGETPVAGAPLTPDAAEPVPLEVEEVAAPAALPALAPEIASAPLAASTPPADAAAPTMAIIELPEEAAAAHAEAPPPTPQVVVTEEPASPTMAIIELPEAAPATPAVVAAAAEPAPTPAPAADLPANVRFVEPAADAPSVAVDPPADPTAAPTADPTAVPEGWTVREQKTEPDEGRMPRWLYKAVYGVEPPDSGADDAPGSPDT